MKERKGFFQRYFIDALGAMAQGLFASLIIGTIFGQLAKIPHMGFLTNFTMHIGDAKSPVIGCAIGVAIAYALGAQKLTLFTSAVTGALSQRNTPQDGSWPAMPSASWYASTSRLLRWV